MMKRDIKINMSQLSGILSKVNRYRDALIQIETASGRFMEVIREQDSDAYDKLAGMWDEKVSANQEDLKGKLDTISEILSGYTKEMETYIQAKEQSVMLRVDRNDIWFNYTQIAQNAVNFLDILSDTGSSWVDYKQWFVYNPLESESSNAARKAAMEAEENAERARRESNYEKLAAFRSKLSTAMSGSLHEDVMGIQQIYNNNVVEFENTDDRYHDKMAFYYDMWSTLGDGFVDVGRGLKDVGRGALAAVIDLVVGVASLLFGLCEIVLWLDCQKWMLDKYGLMPEALDENVQDIFSGMKGILSDPGNALEAIGQGIFDTADEEGVAYSVSYVVTDIVITILIDKGIDKLAGVSKAETIVNSAEGTVKYMDDVADVADVVGDAAKHMDDVADVAGDAVKQAENAAGVLEDAGNAAEAIEGGAPTNTNQYCLSGEEHFEAYKEMFGAENVEWTSRDTLSSADRLRIQDWAYPPTDELYLKYKDVYQNDLYFNQATGDIRWPIDDGFAEYPETITLQPGTIIDRYGSDYGTFTSPQGIPYANRALAPDTELKPYSVFEVVKPIEVQAGKIAPWFNQPGGGIQYMLPDTVDELLDPNVGVLRRLQ
jgi:hypothetical protein